MSDRAAATDRPAASDPRVARLGRALARMVGDTRWRLELWDGRSHQPASDSRFTVRLRSPAALDRLLTIPPDRGLGRAYAEGNLDVEPLEPCLDLLTEATPRQLAAAWPAVVAAAVGLGGRPDLRRLRSAEARLRGRRHSVERDSAAVRFHYDVSPDFFRLWLDGTMTYSCAYFRRPDESIDTAQPAKLEHVCRKLRLREGERLLDIGSGWGSLVLHAVREHGVRATGITLSPPQVETARRAAEAGGLAGRAEFAVADYRQHEGAYDAVASIGMLEHVGRGRMDEYSRAVAQSLRPGGRALIHGITQPVTRLRRSPFIDSFVFPDGELVDLGFLVASLERAGLEVRDVESLREHYALTLDQWRRRLEDRYDEAVSIAGRERARIWRMYITASAAGFRRGAFGVHQILAVRPTPSGASGLPLTRADWYAAAQDGAGKAGPGRRSR